MLRRSFIAMVPGSVFSETIFSTIIIIVIIIMMIIIIILLFYEI